MGLLLSVVISYAGVLEAIECIKHIVSGLIPETEPDFQDIVDYYTKLLNKSANPSTSVEWTSVCQGYLCLNEDETGRLSSAAIKSYDQSDSTAILFSTKISSFGQESIDSNLSQGNGNYKTERYIPAKTKTIITDSLESFSISSKNRSHTSYENVSDPNRYSTDSFEHDLPNGGECNDSKEKLTWHYRPQSPAPKTLPEIHFQSYDGENVEPNVYSEEYLRSLDGIKFRPLQRNDQSNRRRSFKKRHSSSSNSSKESRASREEELKMFTSLEEEEFSRMNKDKKQNDFSSTPNLSARSYSRGRSRDNSKERKNEQWSVEANVDSVEETIKSEEKLRLKDLPKLDSFDEEKETKTTHEVNDEEEEVDFWGNSGD